MESLFKQKYFLGFFILIFLGNLLIFNPQVALWDEDEAAYAGFALNMLESGDWINPDFFWSDKHRKPPFHFWTIALSYQLFGVNEFSTRLPSVFAALLTLFSIIFLGGKAFGKSRAQLAAMVLAATLMFPNLAKMGVTDMTLLLFETVAALSLFLFIKSPGWKYGTLFWSAVALGTLVKGPPVIILAMGIWGFLLFFKSTRPAIIKLHPWFFLPVALLPIIGWGYLSWQRDGGETVNFLVDWYVLKRIGGTGTVLGQTGPPGYHFGVMVLAFLPVFSFFPVALRGLWEGLKKREKEALFFGGWLIFGWLFYEIMPSKLPAYAVGAYPAIAFLIGGQMEAVNSEAYPFRGWVKASSIFFMILMFIVVVAIILGSYQLFGGAGFTRAIFAATVLWGIGLFATLSLFSESFNTGIGSSLYFGLLMTFLTWWAVMPLLDTQRSINRQVALMVKEEIAFDRQLAIGNDVPEDPSLGFYLSHYWDGSYYHERDQGEIFKRLTNDDNFSTLIGERWYTAIFNDSGELPVGLKSLKLDGRASESLEPITYYLIWKE